MKVAMVAYTFYETDNRVRRYAETLAARGDEVEAIVLRRPGQSSFELIEGVKVFRIQARVRDEKGPLSYLSKLMAFFARSAMVLTRRHLKSRYDLIHVHSVPDFQVFAALIPRLTGARVILDIHDIVPELYASKFRISKHSIAFKLLLWMERRSLRFANHVIVANHLWRDRLVQRSVAAERCTTILNYPDPRIFHLRPRIAGREDEFVLCYPGTLSWHQGVDLIILALSRLGERAKKVRLLVFGDGGEREKLIALARENGLADKVSIRAGVPIDQIAKIMSEVDLGVEPKRKSTFANEALSTKILEFMAAGVPVLASDTLVHQMYFDPDSVDYFESENVDAFAGRIQFLMDHPERRETLRHNGLKFVQENNWKEKKHEYLALVDRLVQGRSTKPASSSEAAEVASI